MTTYTLAMTPQEADEIVQGLKTFVFRDFKFKVGYGDRLMFQVYKGGHPVAHPIDRLKYKVTYVSDEAPIEKGWKVIGFMMDF